MLKSISVESLFDIYSYSLDLKPDDSKVRFITGPNGYGKTTILNILDAIYNCDWSSLAKIPFSRIELAFDDDNELIIVQSRHFREDEDSDVKTLADTSLTLSFGKINTAAEPFVAEWNSDSDSFDSQHGADFIRLYFASHPIFYIRDGRLHTPHGVPTIVDCVDKMRSLLRDPDHGKIPASDFNKRLNGFRKIVGCAEFAHKTLQINERYGFRFVSDNNDRTILLPCDLSSGEQHMVVLAFQFLFMAPDDSLVLIDEPEISFHMLWQLDFLKNITTISAIRDLQCIIATHSPQIFNMEWSRTVDLYTQSESSDNGQFITE